MTSQNRPHRSAVIGAGLGGLAAVKCCLDEGIEPVCFEQHADIGGIWNYSPERRPYQGPSAFQNLVTNTARETTTFSDFPIPGHFPQFMSHKDLLQYIKSYAKHFNLLPHIRFNTRVVRVWQREDFSETGQWNVVIKSLKTEQEEHFIFDSVFVCSGMLVDPVYPDLPGREKFRGELMHMLDYRRPEVFQDKKVLVIGNQHSAGDAANEAGTCSKQTYLTPGRSGMVLRTRLNERGQASELYDLSRLKRHLQSQHSIGYAEEVKSQKFLDYKGLGIRHGGNPLTCGVNMMNDELRYKITTGVVKVVDPVEAYTETGVRLTGGQDLDVDMIVLATGYRSNYKFIDVPCIKDSDFRPCADNALCLYKGVFPVDLEGHTLIMADAVAIEGPDMPVMEMRCRWGARVVTGRCELPARPEMREYTRKETEFLRTVCNGKSKLLWYDQCDAIAQEIGVQPNFTKLFLRDPLLAMKVYLGPILPQHYRLLGPGSSPAAAQNCHAAYDRVYPAPDDRRSLVLKATVLASPVLAACVCYAGYFASAFV